MREKLKPEKHKSEYYSIVAGRQNEPVKKGTSNEGCPFRFTWRIIRCERERSRLNLNVVLGLVGLSRFNSLAITGLCLACWGNSPFLC